MAPTYRADDLSAGAEHGALVCPWGPGVAGDGAGLPGEHRELGRVAAWQALDQVFRNTSVAGPRALNVRSKLPKRLQAEVRGRLREMTESETQALCEERREAYVAGLRSKGQGAAAETVLRDWEDFVTFYHYPKEHWVHLRTSNPIESIFSGVRLRTNAARRIRSRENALYLVFKLVERLSGNWRVLNGGENLMALVLAGCGFEDGILKHGQVYGMATAAD